MKKYLLVFIIVLVLSSLAFGQDDISFTKMGLRGSGGSSDYEGIIGETISVSFDYSYTDVDNPSHVYNNTGSGNIDDEIVFLWYSGSSWSSASYEFFDDGISVSNFLSSGSSGTGNGSFDFILPSAPTGGNIITYYQIFFGLKAPDGVSPPFYGDLNTSGKDFSSFTAVNDAPTGYYTYMEFLDDNQTEPPIFNLPLSYSIIADNFTIQYDQPETAYEGSVKLTLTKSSGLEIDNGSPHVLEIESEAMGTDITLTINSANLSGSTGISSLLSGTNYIKDGAGYTIKIEYQDLAQNTVASDQNYNCYHYVTTPYITITGDNYKKGLFINESKNAILRWNFKTNIGTAIVDSIKFWSSGNSDGSDYTSFAIWRSEDNDFNPNIDEKVSSREDFFGYQVFDSSETIDTAGNYYFFVTSISNTATKSDSFGVAIRSVSEVKSELSMVYVATGDLPIGDGTSYVFGGYANLIGNDPISLPFSDNELYYGDLSDISKFQFNTKYITFDGTNYADISTFVPHDVLGGSVFSISFWKNTVDICNYLGTNDASGNEFSISSDGTALGFTFGSAYDIGITTDSSDWENIIITYDKTNVKTYVGNVLQLTKNIGDVSSNYSTAGLYIGGYNNNGSFALGYDGSLDEIAIFDKVLTADDRALIFKGGTIGDCGDARNVSNLKAYWRFEEEDGSIIVDWAE